MNGRTFAWICIYTLFIVSIEALKFDDSCRNSPPFEEWIKFHSELGNSVELTTNEGLICKEEMTVSIIPLFYGRTKELTYFQSRNEQFFLHILGI